VFVGSKYFVIPPSHNMMMLPLLKILKEYIIFTGVIFIILAMFIYSLEIVLFTKCKSEDSLG